MSRKDVHNSEIPVLCRSCEARHRGICGALNPDELIALSRHSSQVKVTSGAELIAEQEAVVSYANVLKGVVKLSKLMADGRQQIVGLQFAPDLLGRPFQDESSVTAEAATDVQLCVFSRAALEKAVDDSHELTKRLHGQCMRELDDARDWMLTLGRKTAYEKVASFLKLIATAYDPERNDLDGVVRFELPLTRHEMADFLGLTTETVSRQMTALRKNGIIETIRSHIIIVHDWDALAQASGT